MGRPRLYPRECSNCLQIYQERSGFYHHISNGTCDRIRLTKCLPKVPQSNTPRQINTINNNSHNNTTNNIINIYINNNDDLDVALEQLTKQKLITSAQLEQIKPIQQMLQDKGCTSIEQVLGLIDSLSQSTEEMLDAFKDDLSGIAKKMNNWIRSGTSLHLAYDEKNGTTIDMTPAAVISYFAQKLWVDLFLPDLDECINNRDKTLERLITRSVRKDVGAQAYCDVKSIAKVTADGKLLEDKDEDWKKYYADYGLESTDAIDSDEDENDILFRRAQAKHKFEAIDVYKYTKWTRSKWDTVITNGLSTISESICRTADRELLEPLLHKTLIGYVRQFKSDETPDKLPYITITDKAKRDLEKIVIADGKESSVAAWRVIADFLEKTSAQHQRVKRNKSEKSVPFRVRGKKAQNQIALQTNAELLPIK